MQLDNDYLDDGEQLGTTPDYVTEWLEDENVEILGRIERHWDDGIGQAYLVFNRKYACLKIIYSEVRADGTYRWNKPPSNCVRSWIHQFVRRQDHLEPDSYYVEQWPDPMWIAVLTCYAEKEGSLKV